MVYLCFGGVNRLAAINLTFAGCEDRGLEGKCQMGFPIVGEMQPLMAGTVEEDKLNTPKPVQELLEEQERTNYQVAARVKPSDWSEEVMEKTMSDSEIGRMSVPLRKQRVDLMRCSLNRRLAVNEYREYSGGWRRRMVDHFTESGVNAATWCTRKLQNDSLDALWWIVWFLFLMNVEVELSKSDVKDAYRLLPVLVSHLIYTGVIFEHEDEQWVSFHKSLPFGAVASCHGWHQMASLLSAVLRRVLFIPTLKYVDDFFSAGRKGVYYNMSRCAEIIGCAIGVGMDPLKSERFMTNMVILGVEVILCWERKAIKLILPEDKAKRWKEDDAGYERRRADFNRCREVDGPTSVDVLQFVEQNRQGPDQTSVCPSQ